MFAVTGGAFAPLVLAAGLCQVGFVRVLRSERGVQRRVRFLQGPGRPIPGLDGAAALGLEIRRLDLEPGQHPRGPLALGGRVLDGRGQRRHRVDHRLDVAASLLHALLGGVDSGLRRGEGLARHPHVQKFERDLGNGQKVFTFVIWAQPEVE